MSFCEQDSESLPQKCTPRDALGASAFPKHAMFSAKTSPPEIVNASPLGSVILTHSGQQVDRKATTSHVV